MRRQGRRPKGTNTGRMREKSPPRCPSSPPGNGAGNRKRSRSRCRSSSRSPARTSTTTTDVTIATDAKDTTRERITGTSPNTRTIMATSKQTTTRRTLGDASPQNGRVVVGVVGGLVGGVAITVVIILLWRSFRAKKRRGDRLKGEENTARNMEFINTSNPTSSVMSTVPDVIMVSTAQLNTSDGEAEYEVIQEEADYHLANTMVSASNQADYTEIPDTEKVSTSRPAADYFVLENVNLSSGDYNRLRDAPVPTEVKGTYNRLGNDASVTSTDVNGTYNRLGDDASVTSTDVNGTYNRLGNDASVTPTDENGTYNRLGEEPPGRENMC